MSRNRHSILLLSFWLIVSFANPALARSREFSGEGFFFGIITTAILSGIIYFLIKFAAKLGVLLIPLLVGLIGGLALRGRGLSEIFGMMILGVSIGIGVVGVLMCATYASLYDLQKASARLGRQVRKMSKAMSANSSEKDLEDDPVEKVRSVHARQKVDISEMDPRAAQHIPQELIKQPDGDDVYVDEEECPFCKEMSVRVERVCEHCGRKKR